MTHYEMIQDLAKRIRHGVLTYDEAVYEYRKTYRSNYLIPVAFRNAMH